MSRSAHRRGEAERTYHVIHGIVVAVSLDHLILLNLGAICQLQDVEVDAILPFLFLGNDTKMSHRGMLILQGQPTRGKATLKMGGR